MPNIIRMISKFNFSSRNGTNIKYIIIHYTGNSKDTAKSNADYFNECKRDSSAHYFVDDNTIYQVVEENNSAWAIGDGKGVYGITNRNSISIEMCTGGSFVVSNKTEANTIELVRVLMKKYNIDIDHVVRHYDASRKVCPNWDDNKWSRWFNFKKKISGQTTWKAGWNQNDTGWFYCTDLANKYYYTSNNGWKEIDGEWYIFNAEGYAIQNDWYYDRVSGNWFYLDNNCKMVRARTDDKPEWKWVDGSCYAFNTDGVMYTSCITPDGYTITDTGAWNKSIPQIK